MTVMAFVATETTGPGDDCDVWEIGIVCRRPGVSDSEHRWLLRPELGTADPAWLRLGRYYDRIGRLGSTVPGFGRYGDDDTLLHVSDIAVKVATLLDGAVVVGAVPDFDARHLAAARHLARWLRDNGQAGTWHHHLVDVEALAAGALRMPPPWDADEVLEVYGLRHDPGERHTALGDARLVRDLYDRVLTGERPPTRLA